MPSRAGSIEGAAGTAARKQIFRPSPKGRSSPLSCLAERRVSGAALESGIGAEQPLSSAQRRDPIGPKLSIWSNVSIQGLSGEGARALRGMSIEQPELPVQTTVGRRLLCGRGLAAAAHHLRQQPAARRGEEDGRIGEAVVVGVLDLKVEARPGHAGE